MSAMNGFMVGRKLYPGGQAFISNEEWVCLKNTQEIDTVLDNMILYFQIVMSIRVLSKFYIFNKEQ